MATHSGRLAGYRPWSSKLIGQDLVTKQQLSNCSSFFHSVPMIILVMCLIKKAASALKSSLKTLLFEGHTSICMAQAFVFTLLIYAIPFGNFPVSICTVMYLIMIYANIHLLRNFAWLASLGTHIKPFAS